MSAKNLADANIHLAEKACRRFVRGNGKWQEYLGVAYEGLLAAAKSFKGDRGAAFNTYANIRIIGAIKDEMRKEYGRKGRIKLPVADAYEVSGTPAASSYDPVEQEDTISFIATRLVNAISRPQHDTDVKMRRAVKLMSEGHCKDIASKMAGWKSNSSVTVLLRDIARRTDLQKLCDIGR